MTTHSLTILFVSTGTLIAVLAVCSPARSDGDSIPVRGGLRGVVPATDAIGREFTIFRGSDPPRLVDAIGREFSIFRGSTVVPRIMDAISREFTVSVTPFLGDADGNCVVDFGDITAVLTNWGRSYLPKPAGGPGDANGDAIVTFADITKVLTNWGAVCP